MIKTGFVTVVSFFTLAGSLYAQDSTSVKTEEEPPIEIVTDAEPATETAIEIEPATEAETEIADESTPEFAPPPTPKRYPSIAIGAGILSYNGDVGIGSYSKRRPGFNITVEQRIKKHFAVSLSGLYGKLADHDDRSIYNFESKITQASLNLLFYFGNDLTKFSPYITAGAGYLMFDTYSDQTDKNGITYNYWENGTLQSLPENSIDKNNAEELDRDYTYETSTIKQSGLSFPLGLGINFRISEKLHVKASGKWYLTLTDSIDNRGSVGHEKNDRFIFANVSFQYTFGKKADINANDNFYTSETFTTIDQLDSDADGIVDSYDNCPGTPLGVAVDAETGCPIDTDKDGVADYLDEETDTEEGAVVNTKGITQTGEMIAERRKDFEEGASKRLHAFIDNPSETKELINQRNNNTLSPVLIPEPLKIADGNKDGIISTDEIGASIDAFFDGNENYSVDKLNDLIDLFFEQ